MLLAQFVHNQFKAHSLLEDEEAQLKILHLAGTTLIPEENIIIGYLPLMSYFTSKKDIKKGVKCPQDQEDLIRAIIIKEALEKIGCTVDRLKSAGERPESKKQKSKDEEIFDQIDSLNDGIKTSVTTSKPLIVLDAQNIAMRHGKDKFFSVMGIQIAINYWRKNGHQVVCFVPDYLLDYNQVAEK